MIVEARVTIQGSRAAAWATLTDVDKAATIVRGIEAIEVVARPASGLVGLRWRETRILFGEAATVEKRITEATESAYTTQAEDGGFVFVTTHRLEGSDGAITVVATHETRPQGFVAAVKSLPMFLFKRTIQKAILQDLSDIKSAVESGAPSR